MNTEELLAFKIELKALLAKYKATLSVDSVYDILYTANESSKYVANYADDYYYD